MEIQIDQNDASIQQQASVAGFETVQDYVENLLQRDAERLAVLEGLQAAAEGRVRPIEEFERDFRERNSLGPRV